MSVYSTIYLTEMEAVEKIAEHIGIELDWNGFHKLEKRRSKQDLLSMILFQLTDNNPYSPNHYNNYIVTETKPNSEQEFERSVATDAQ